MDGIRMLIAATIQGEESLLLTRTQKANKDFDSSILLRFIGLALVLILIILGFMLKNFNRIENSEAQYRWQPFAIA